MKKVIAFVLVANMILMFCNTAFSGEYRDKFYIGYNGQVYRYTSKLVSLVIDGKPVETGDMPAIIIDGRTLVPAREVFESAAINAEVEWNGSKNEVTISYKDKVVILTIGSNKAVVNGEAVTLEVPASLIRDMSKQYSKTMIPLRFVTETLGYGVTWDNATFTASITSPVDNIDPNSGSAITKKVLPTYLADNPIVWESATSGETETSPVTMPIEPQDYPEVNVTAINYIEENGKGKFVIQASGPISSAETLTLSGRYVIDIHGANYAFDNNKLYESEFSQNSTASAVRSSPRDYDSAGKQILRVVFDVIDDAAQYNISLSQDRMTLIFEKAADRPQSVVLAQNEKGDYIQIKGIASTNVKTFRLSNPDRIVVDLENTVSQIGGQANQEVLGQYVKSIRTAQFDTDTTRVVVETEGLAAYSITKVDAQTTIIELCEPTGILNDPVQSPTITLENAKDIPLDQITYEDRFYERKYIIHLPGNYENVFGTSGIQANDSNIASMDIITNNITGNTDIVIKEKGIFEFKIESDEDSVYIRAYKPRELYSKILVLDFGHGGSDPGAVNKNTGLQEKDLNLSIGNMVKGYMELDPSIKVYLTRRDDTKIELQERTDIANLVEADFFVSIHNNSFKDNYTGTETIYFEDQDRPGLNSVELAEIMHRHVLAATGLPDRKIKPNNTLFVLRNNKMPAVILEEGFVSNATDSKLLADPVVQDKIARAIYEGIEETFAKYPTGR